MSVIMYALEAKECAHAWVDVCAVYHRRLGVEGMAIRCGCCDQLGLRKADGEIVLVNGRDVFQAEYRADGRPSEVWDAHL